MYEISELTGNIYFNGVLVPQDDTNPMWQAYWQHKQNGGKFVFVEATSEEIAQIQTETQEQLKQQQYTELLETDWYVVRFAERGIPIPTEILEQRQAIREKYQ